MHRHFGTLALTLLFVSGLALPLTASAGVRGKAYSITGQDIIGGTTFYDVYRFNADNSFNADSNPAETGTWTELDLLLFSFFVATIEFQDTGVPLPVSANIVGLSLGGSQIGGIGLARIGTLIIVNGTFSGTQIP